MSTGGATTATAASMLRRSWRDRERQHACHAERN
jgi:hypothetical protein